MESSALRRHGVNMSSQNNPLVEPFQLGSIALPNRVVMAPLTRNRADHATGAPHDLNARY